MTFFLSTSRKASYFTKRFAKDLMLSFPQSIYFNRNNKSLHYLINKSFYFGLRFVLIVREKKRKPSEIQVIECVNKKFKHLMLLKVSEIILRKDFSDFKASFDDLELDLDKLKGLFKFFGLNSIKDSLNKLVERNGLISFYSNGIEVGPKFLITEKIIL